jgi:hypothetical protein
MQNPAAYTRRKLLITSFLLGPLAADLSGGDKKRLETPKDSALWQRPDTDNERTAKQTTFFVMEPVSGIKPEEARFQLRIVNVKGIEYTHNSVGGYTVRPAGQEPFETRPPFFQVVETYSGRKAKGVEAHQNLAANAGERAEQILKWYGVDEKRAGEVIQHMSQYDQRRPLIIPTGELNPSARWKENLTDEHVQWALNAKANPPAELPTQPVRLPRGVDLKESFMPVKKGRDKGGK